MPRATAGSGATFCTTRSPSTQSATGATLLRWGPEQRVADDHPGIALVADSFSPLAPPGSHQRLRRRRGVWSSILNRLRSEMRLLGPLAVLPRHVIDIDPTCVPLLTLAGPRTVRISAPSSLFE